MQSPLSISMDFSLLTATRLPLCSVRFCSVPLCRRIRIPLLLRASKNIPVSSLAESSSSDGYVDVIGIGSRKHTVMDFCLGSPFASASRVRFWTINSRDSLKAQPLHKTSREGNASTVNDGELDLFVLSQVASAGYGSDEAIALQLLNSVKSEGGLAVSVLLMPFSFEGQRRQQEVDNLVNKLQKCSNCYIVVETEALLKTKEETLAEAIKIVNNAVLASINIISLLTNDLQLKYLTMDEDVKELQFPEIVKLFESYGETKIGYGAGYDIKSSISQAVFNCPFLINDMKSSSGIVIFNLARAKTIDKGEVTPIVKTFHWISQCNKHVVFCGVHEPALEQNLVVTTLLVLGNCSDPTMDPPNNVRSSSLSNFSVSEVKHNSEFDIHGDELQNLHPSQEPEKQLCSKTAVESKNDHNLFQAECESILDGFKFDEDENGLQREQLISWNFGSGFNSAQLWAEERAAYSRVTNTEMVNIFSLPVGVKHPEQYDDFSYSSEVRSDIMDACSVTMKNNGFPSTDALPCGSLEAALRMCNSASTHFDGKIVNSSRKKGLLSIRAASMLEAEREPGKKWAPLVEMEYRGGIYRGRCQGGLPEGKGHLTFPDGSFYDGMWHYGKRSGLGTFHFGNGDVFQGMWRDDFMHGKGWFYFHTGDRWFVNFWKGKPNGEGRFYSKKGSVFFGHFRDGWRHGECLYIDTNGMRWAEIWDIGVRISQINLDTQSDG